MGGRHGRAGGALAGLALVLAGCAGPGRTSVVQEDGGGAGAVRVVATTSVLGDVVAQVVGDAAAVETLMPPGADPHSFEPSARQIESLQGASLVVANGAGFEEGLLDVLEAAQADGVAIFNAGDHVDLLAFGEQAEHDPHFFQDPSRMAAAVRALGPALAEASPARSPQEWDVRAEAYAAQLDTLDAEIAGALSAIPDDRRRLVTNHDAFAYLADRYDLAIVGTVIPGGTTLEDPSAADLEALAATIADEGVPAIFAENTSVPALAEALAAETGTDVEVVELFSDSLGEPGSEGATYADMLRVNAGRIAEALG